MKKRNDYFHSKKEQRQLERELTDVNKVEAGLDQNIADLNAAIRSEKKKLHFLKKMEVWQEEQLKKYGFYIHFVFDEERTPNYTNIHTHGIMENFNHPDLQICLPITDMWAKFILHTIVDKIKSGEYFKTDVEYPDILADNYKVKFIKAIECRREILRVILPDVNHQFDSPGYIDQFEMLNNE